ncbi:MAG: DUF983 domain-containing protein [Alphaproteobacteria bacterium]
MIFPLALINKDAVKTGWTCKCPQCKTGNLYKPGLTMDLREQCENCGLDFTKNDSADGPAVFLIFILGVLLVPMALILDSMFHWPLWLHAVIWGIAAVTLTVGALRPLKAYIIALQFKHRASDWK